MTLWQAWDTLQQCHRAEEHPDFLNHQKKSELWIGSNVYQYVRVVFKRYNHFLRVLFTGSKLRLLLIWSCFPSIWYYYPKILMTKISTFHASPLQAFALQQGSAMRNMCTFKERPICPPIRWQLMKILNGTGSSSDARWDLYLTDYVEGGCATQYLGQKGRDRSCVV